MFSFHALFCDIVIPSGTPPSGGLRGADETASRVWDLLVVCLALSDPSNPIRTECGSGHVLAHIHLRTIFVVVHLLLRNSHALLECDGILIVPCFDVLAKPSKKPGMSNKVFLQVHTPSSDRDIESMRSSE